MQQMTFLNWDQPLLHPLVNHLLALGDKLVDHIVIVPTAQSGRQLRKALAETGIGLTPKVATPEILRSDNKGNPGFRAAMLTAWTEALTQIDLTETPSLFPTEPPEGVANSFRWAFNVGKQLSDLQCSLQDNDKSFLDISRMSMEPERWQDLVKLEGMVKKRLRNWRVQIDESYQPISTPSNPKKLIIAGVCDLSPQATKQLEELLQNNTSVEIIVHAPEHLRCHFDDWGRPQSEYWSNTDLDIPNWQNDITLAETPSLAAEHIVREVATKQLTPDQLTLGLCDRDMVLSLQNEFSSAGWDVYDPEGSNIKSSSLVLFLTALAEWVPNHSSTKRSTLTHPLNAFAQMLRLPEMEAFLPEKTDRYSIIRELDKCMEKRMPVYATELNEHLQKTNNEDYKNLAIVLSHFLTETENLLSGNKIKGLRGWIARILNRTSENIASLLVDDFTDICDVLENVERYSRKEGLVISQVIEIIIDTLADKKSYENYAGTTCDLLGWMELMYEDSPELYLIGMHEDEVPEFRGDDPFLPDSFRESIGMQSGANYYARDSYLFHSLVQSRKKTHIIISKLSESNEPKTPSRILLRSSGQELASRVQKLFGDPQLESENPSSWKRDWQLKVPEVLNPYDPKQIALSDSDDENNSIRSLSPSALKDYLHCPFRFFLKRVVRMKRYNANKCEMNALDFGLLVHAIVESFGKDETIRDSTSAKEIQSYFDDQLTKELFNRYGAYPNLAIKMQAEIAKSRLHKLATMQADEAEQGWRIIDVELNVGVKENDIPWDINGHPIIMQVDRVEKHQHTGELRVLDYKTSGMSESPITAHISNLKPDENRPICGNLLPKAPRSKSERCWKNLQLPIYAWFIQHHYKTDEIPSIGYINLPKTISESSFSIWEDFDETLLESAQEWTINTIKKIQQNEFFSPTNLSTKEQKWDDFSKLAQGDITEAFAL